jgi:flagellin-like hook-associated protein FlgL
MKQLDTLADDAMYKGVNLLQSDTLNVVFNTNNDKLAVSGFNAHASGLTITSGALTLWGASTTSVLIAADLAAISTAITDVDDAIATLRSEAKTLASNLGIVTTRQSFTDKMIATLKIGGDNLTLADMNEEGANMLMLQTRQALGIQSLSMASQSAQQVLQLFQ